MHRYSATDSNLEILGALALERVGEALRPYRLPAGARPQVPAAFMEAMVLAAAGVRIRFATSASKIVVILNAHPIQLVGIAPAFPAKIDLLVNGELVDSAEATGEEAKLDLIEDSLTVGQSASQRVSFSLNEGNKVVEIWLPHTAIVEFCGIEADEPITLAEIPKKPIWVHHGSSISHCMETPHPTGTWPAIAARALGFELLDLAFAGNAQLDPFVARAIRDVPADVITLKLGINLVNANSMTMRAFRPAVEGFLDTVRDGHPQTPIVVISPISCPTVEERPGPTGLDPQTGIVMTFATEPYLEDALTLGRIRLALAEIVERRSAEDAYLTYIDGRQLFDETDASRGLLPDGLHPNTQGYLLMGQRFAQLFPATQQPTQTGRGE